VLCGHAPERQLLLFGQVYLRARHVSLSVPR